MTARAQLQRWLSETTGIELSRGGVGRCLDEVIDRRCRELGCSEADYVVLARESSRREFELLANAITVVYTWFFRDRGQMAAIESVLQQRRGQRTPVRIWVPGCATGEDCFSISMIAERLDVAVSILGTDINTIALQRAKGARYPKASLREADEAMLRHFQRHSDGSFELSARIRQGVEFNQHNLSSGTPDSSGPGWDLILCRNVLIYFKPERALAVFEAMTRALAQDGVMLLGASEVVYDVPEQLCAVYHAGRLVLQKKLRSAPVPSADAPLVDSQSPHRPPLPALPNTVQELTVDRPVPGRAKEARAQAQHLLQGHEQLDAGRIVEALEHYELAVANDPTWPEAHMYRGIARYLKGDVDAAAHDLRAALFLDSELWQAAFYLALSYEGLGLIDGALREYRHVVRLSERTPGAVRKAHPLLVEWQGDVVELARRRLSAGGGAKS